MPEENQIQMNQTSTPMNSNIRERLSWLRSFREGAVLRKAKQTQDTLDADSNNLFEQSLNVNNKELSQRYNQASQSAAAASMIKSYAEKNGDDWSDLNTPQEILTEYFTLNPDDETYNKIMDFTQSNRDPEEFWLEMWWIEPIKESFMDKAKDGIVWPFARAVWAIWGTIWWIGEWTWNALKRAYNNMWDIKDIATDDNKSFIEKFNQILLWEGVLDTVWGWIWDIIWWWIEWAFKWFTTQWERDSMSDSVAWFIKKALETDMWEEALVRWNNLTPEEQKEAEDYLTYIDWAMNLSVAWAAKEPLKAWIRWGIKWARAIAKEAWPVIKSVEKWIKEQAKKQATKNAIKNVAKNEAELEKIANIVWQWTTKDIPTTTKALKTLSKHTDLKSIKSWQELDNAWYSVEGKLSQIVDENLSKYPWKIKAADQKIIKVDWKDEWRYVEEAIDDLLDVYKQERNYEAMNRITKFWEDFMWDGVSYKELNDFAREYWNAMKAWNAKNQITTNAKQWWEATRSWIKDLIRERVPANEFKDIDAEIGSIANFSKLVSKTIEWVNNTEKRLRERWITETLRKKYSDIKNFIMWAERSETENLYHIEERLPQLLERFDKLNNDIIKAEKASEIGTLINDAEKEMAWVINATKEELNTIPLE